MYSMREPPGKLQYSVRSLVDPD